MPTNIRATPPNTFPIANLADRAKEQAAAKFDPEAKGYLTYDQLIAWYQSENQGSLPNLSDMARFLGRPQHELAVEHLNGWEVLQSQWLASSWKGDFRIPGFSNDANYAPAGNVRVGREIGPQWNENNEVRDVDQTVFLLDFNLIKLEDFDQRVKNAVLVVGPEGFPREHAQARYGEAVEIPLTLLSQEGYQSFSRFGPAGWVPDKKLLAAQVDTADLRKLMGAAPGLSFFVRLETNDGRTLFVNKDGKPFNDFSLSAAELQPPGAA